MGRSSSGVRQGATVLVMVGSFLAAGCANEPTAPEPHRSPPPAIQPSIVTGDVVELPPLPGDAMSRAIDVNDAGLVVGVSGTGSVEIESPRPVLWKDGVPEALPLPGGAVAARPVRINAAGQILGQTSVGGVSDLVIWENGSVRELGIPVPRYIDFNDAGHVAGIDLDGAFVWRDGVVTRLPDWPGERTWGPVFLNNSDDVVETAYNPDCDCGLDGSVLWRSDVPVAFGGGVDLRGFTDEGVAVFYEFHSGIARWDGEVATAVPGSSGFDGHGGVMDVTPGGRILQMVFGSGADYYSYAGIWEGDRFEPLPPEFRGSVYGCRALSDGGYVTCQDHDHTSRSSAATRSRLLRPTGTPKRSRTSP
jgi:hypothetical protein